MRRAAVLFAGAVVLCSGLLPWRAQAAEAAPAADAIPTRAFFRRPDLGAARLSPSGRWLAVLLRSPEDRLRLAVLDLQGKSEPTVVAAYADADVRSFDWVNDDRLVFNIIDFQRGGQDQTFGPGLYSVRRDGSESRLLIASRVDFVREARATAASVLGYNHHLLWVPRRGGNEVIIGQEHYNNKGDPEHLTPLRLDVTTGRVRSATTDIPPHAHEWLFDADGNPRVVQTQFQGRSEVFWRDEAASGKWRSLAAFPTYDSRMEPEFVDAEGRLFVSTASPLGTTVLHRFDFTAGKPEDGAVVSTPGFDFNGSLLTDLATQRVIGVRVTTDAESTVWFDSGVRKLQAVADARFPGHINRVTCRSCTQPDGMLLVFSYSDQDPGSYWVYRTGSQAWESVGKTRADIDPVRMAQMDLYRIKARDGQDLPVWVTLPRRRGGGLLPAVVLVHGGPWVHGENWHWNGEAQFLAARGYAVIEPQYRGTLGYGRKHFESSWKRWGTTMQDDVADAVQWAAENKLLDPKRVCIAGASYGGYATLMGLIRHPDLYRCGVAWAAVTDPRLRFEESWASDSTPEVREFSLPLLVGDPVQDADLLNAATPVLQAKKIRAPVFLAFGREDRRVPLDHGTRMRAALRAGGQEPEWVVYEGEGHGWLRLDHNIDFYDRMDRFLRRSLN